MILPNTLKIQAEALPFFNISTYQNGRSFIRSLYIQNSGDSPTEAVTIKIYTDSAGLEPFEYSLPYLPAQSNILIPTDKIKINKNHLHQLSESEQVTVFVEVYDQKGLNSQEKLEVDFQPLEHFGGFEVLPELIASYITPNHPYVYHIKRKAIEVLEKKGLPTAFEGYQKSDPERVLQVLSAIYTAIQEENIIYSSLAPGYEQRGQRLRLLHTIQKEQFANCIDISLLFGACLEAVDLNPILIILEGHAYVGCWLHDDKFPEIINDDKAAITKRLSKGIREIVALEATSVCKGNDVKFSDALALGESQLIQNEKFLLSVDIKRARTAFIRPLPLLHEGDTMILDTSVASSPIAGEMEDRFEIGTIYQDELLSKPHSRTKQKVWERNLLDLSLRNSLLNLRMTRNMLQIVDIDISHFEDTLSEGKSFYIMPSMQADVQKKYNLFSAPLHQSSSLFQLASEELKSNRLLTYYHQQDLDNILTYIHKNAKQAIEENGSSTLYLAVGLLKWFDKKTPEQTRYAPILLVPVEIGRRSVNSKFTLKSREEETMINITLVEFLRQEYELNLSALEQLPYDDKGVDVAKVMGILRRAVMQMKGWDVEEQLVLGNFSFNKLILWKDIVDYTEDLMKSSMVKSLIEGRLTFEENDSINIEDSLDRIASAELALPIPTDASQMEAVWAADQGNSFILHGPPGTGKSQTITNIIANALFKGKRVLFVAAKKAALDVVHKRLESIGLGTFSLELHSNKSKKSDVLEQLSQSIDAIRQTSNVDFEVEAQRLDAAKESIRHYVELLHKTQVTGWSLYDSMVVLEDYEHYQFGRKLLPQAILDKLNPNLWREWLDWLPQFQTLIGIVKHPSENPLESLRIKQYAQSLHEELIQKVEELIPTLEKLEQNINNAKVSLNLSVDINNKADLDRFTEVLSQILLLEDIPVPLFKFLAKRDNQEIFEEWIKLLETFIEKRNHVLKDFESTIFELNVNIKELEWKQANQKWF
ncbi:DUF4011 domain-containing protein [Belliella kenyensis]|nr:DUF4011 domain-containing protein [Belliella kenyensis]MDN3605279.1 DUF4011 domain-containing protein [Belliella kenyensis]